MNYYRAIVYLKKVDHGVVMANGGYGRLEKRDGGVRVYVAAGKLRGVSGAPVYLVYEREKKWLPHLMGVMTESGEAELCCALEYLPHHFRAEEVGGILVGDKDFYLWGSCGSFPDMIDFEQINFGGEEVGNEVVRAQNIEQNIEQNEMAERGKKENREDKPEGLEEMYPFEDDEMEWCFQMTPDDFFRFPMECWHFGKNSFLLEGFYNYRHLLYAHKEGRDYIGVPGQFHRREQYLAGKFGFSRFKGIRKKHLTAGDYGYWLREL